MPEMRSGLIAGGPVRAEKAQKCRAAKAAGNPKYFFGPLAGGKSLVYAICDAMSLLIPGIARVS